MNPRLTKNPKWAVVAATSPGSRTRAMNSPVALVPVGIAERDPGPSVPADAQSGSDAKTPKNRSRSMPDWPGTEIRVDDGRTDVEHPGGGRERTPVRSCARARARARRA